MPSPYARDLPALKAEILARVAAGERLRVVCAGPGMPCPHTVQNWAVGDAAFGAELARARAREPERVRDLLEELGRARRRAFDPVLADRIIVGLHKGLKLEAVLAADPELPCRPTLTRWRREAPEFDRVLKMIFAAWRSRGSGLAGGRVRGLGRERAVPETVRQAVCGTIADGGTFASLAREGFASRTTLRRWYRADVDFADAVDRACAAREEALNFELWVAAEGVPPGPVREMNRAVAPITRSIARLRHRPGAMHRRRGG
jgi:hypothetical protein